MKNALLAALFFACCCAAASGQSPAFCPELLQKAKAALAQKQYSKSRDYCEAALPLCPEYAVQLDAVMTDVRAAIEREKQAAVAGEKKARQALQKQQAALAEVVRLTLRDAYDRIYHLDYEAALEKMQTAAALGVLPQQVSDSLLEVAFFFAETRQPAQAGELLSTAARLAGKPAPRLFFEGCATWRDTTEHLRAAIRALSRDSALQARYFPTMLPIPGGVDTLGSEKNGDEKPRHAVRLSPFHMAQTETTCWQYNLFCEATGHEKPEKPTGWGGEGDNPVVNVSWYDAVEYANWLSAREGLDSAISEDSIQLFAPGYRLPTEAEWEYAARGGEEFEYAGSADLDSVAWHLYNSGSRTHPVGRKKANAFGLFDMSGNVWEWCWDWYAKDYYEQFRSAAAENPTGPSSGAYRVIRGGGWDHYAASCRAAYRYSSAPTNRGNGLGFRLARSF